MNSSFLWSNNLRVLFNLPIRRISYHFLSEFDAAVGRSGLCEKMLLKLFSFPYFKTCSIELHLYFKKGAILITSIYAMRFERVPAALRPFFLNFFFCCCFLIVPHFILQYYDCTLLVYIGSIVILNFFSWPNTFFLIFYTTINWEDLSYR